MRFVLLVVLSAIAGGCATTSGEWPYVSPGVTSSSSTAIDVTAYNREIQRQGMEHYCRAGYCDELPTLLEAYAPIYPAAELEAGVNGQATIVFDILETGALANFEVESASTDNFASAAIEALKLWRFEPPKRAGRPVGTSGRQSFPFVAL